MDGFVVKGDAYKWGSWLTLDRALSEPVLPTQAGLYRIRRVGVPGVDYIGQTGVGIRARVRMLRGVSRPDMPYRDPHTAAPAFWALLQSTGCKFEVSGLPLQSDPSWRKGLEAVAIALYRQKTGYSPTVNFGRMPSGFRMSSGNTAKLNAAGKKARGGPAKDPDASHLPGIPPVGGLEGDPEGMQWCGHNWSGWLPLREYGVAVGVGLYRIRSRSSEDLVYIGQGVLRSRLGTHLRKTRPSTIRTSHEQLFADAVGLELSYVVGQWESHQRLELETDLIAAYVLRLGRVPPAQFIG